MLQNVTTGGIKHMGTHNRSENSRDAWVALCDHLIHTHTERMRPGNYFSKIVPEVGFFALRFNKITIPGPREERSWPSLI
jgi:hypothetical protein